MKNVTGVIKNLIKVSKIGDSIDNIEDLTDGFSGFVYKVTVRKGNSSSNLAVKLIPSNKQKDESKVDTLERIYGSRSSNFESAYEVLKKYQIKVPEVCFYSGASEQLPYTRIVMEYLPGISVRPFLKYKSHTDMDGLHRLCGHAFAKVHTIQRDYDGYPSDRSPSLTSWGEDLVKAYEILIEKLNKKEVMNSNLVANVRYFFEKAWESFTEPTKFVFSHIDGFQAIAQYNGGWDLQGIIDFEDHKYVDQRFALAGYELSQEYEDRAVPDCFYKAYADIVEIDSTFVQVRDLYKLLYLLSWYNDFVSGFTGGKEEGKRIRGDLISAFAKLLDKDVKDINGTTKRESGGSL